MNRLNYPMMTTKSNAVEKRYWCMISTDGKLNMHFISDTITTQEEITEHILSAFDDEMSSLVQDDVVFGPHAIAWLEMNALVDELPINQLASDLSELIRKSTVWPHPLRGYVAFMNTKIWNTFE